MVVPKVWWWITMAIRPHVTRVVIVTAVFLFCVIGYVSTVIPIERKSAALQQEARLLQLSRDKQVQRPGANDVASQAVLFYSDFPLAHAMPQLMEKLYGAATQQLLVVEQGEYKLVRKPENKLLRYEISFPVKGEYLRIQEFIALALNELPTLALNSASFSRQKVNESAVEAQLDFTLFMRES